MDEKFRVIYYLKCSKIYVKVWVFFGLNEEFFFLFCMSVCFCIVFLMVFCKFRFFLCLCDILVRRLKLKLWLGEWYF